MESSIQTQFGIPTGVSTSYWVRLEEEEPIPETVTPEEAATVIDALYDIDPCTGATGEEQVQGVLGSESESAEDLQEEYNNAIAEIQAAFGSINYNPCLIAPNFEYTAKIRVIRSHLDQDYNLVLNNAVIESTEVKTMVIDDFIQVDGDSVTLNYPVDGNVTCAVGIESIDGSHVTFTSEIFGYIRFQYSTTIDVVTINVKALDEEAQDCLCLCFYMGNVAELTVSPPEVDENGVAIIGCGVTAVNWPPDSEVDDSDDEDSADICYQRYIYQYICRCSGTVKDSSSQVVVVPCSTPFSSENIAGVYDSFQEAKYYNAYTQCLEEGEWEGADADFYEDTCCEPPDPDDYLPPCQRITRGVYGFSDIDGGRDGREVGFPNDTVSFVPVPPRNGLCGTLTKIYEVEAKDCCDSEFYEDLVYDTDRSADIIADNSSGTVYWTGGFIDPDDEHNRSIATMTVHGSGFYTNAAFTKKSITAAGGATIYTDDACGSCTISISDNCSETGGSVKSTEGHWQTVSNQCDIKGTPASEKVGDELWYYEGTFRYHQSFMYIWGGFSKNVSICADCPHPTCWGDLPPFVDCMHWNTAGCLTWYRADAECEDDCGLTVWTGCDPEGTYWWCTWLVGEKRYSQIIKEEWQC